MGAVLVRLVRGLAALVALVVLLVGIPVLLWTVGGSPLPDAVPSWNQVVSTLTHPDLTGSLLLATMKVVAWLGWLTFAVAVLIEIPAALRGVSAPRLRGIGLQQRAAAALLIAVITMGASSGPADGPAAATPSEVPNAPVATASASVLPLVPGQGDLMTVTDAMHVAPAGAPDGAQAPVERHQATSDQRSEASAPLATYEVQRGDNLWSIAEAKLGDGQRYGEIVELNVGVQQADGYALEPGSDWIEPGWVLTLPVEAEAPAPAAEARSVVTHVVQPGESLSSIAQQHLGDADRYPELFEASQETVQDHGERLTDPRLIRPGWVITVPLDDGAPSPGVPSAEAPTGAADPAPQPAPARTAAVPPVDVAVVPGAGAQVDTAADVDEVLGAVVADSGGDTAADPDAEETDAMPLETRTAAGIGGFLACGLLGLLAGRRAVSRRRRQAGERVPVPAVGSGTAAHEAELRAVSDAQGRETLDVALRALATWHRDQGRPLPEMDAVRLTGQAAELRAAGPVDLPDPWHPTADRQVWRLDVRAVDDAMREAAGRGEAPWPTLVTIGHDDDGFPVLVDLERARCLDVAGDPEVGRAVLSALTVELATSVWADDLQVTLLGDHAVLPGVLGTGRVRHVASPAVLRRELEARADDVVTALAEAGAGSVRDARGRGIAADSWTPEILLVGEVLDDADRDALERLVAQMPGVCLVAVTTGDRRSTWTLDLTTGVPGRGVLHPLGLLLHPQHLGPDEVDRANELLAQTEPRPGPTWARHLTDDEVPLDRIPRAETAGSPTPDGSPLDVPVVDRVEDEPDDDAPTLARVVALRPPLLRVLGPVELEVTSGVELPPAERRQATELIAYLLFHPGATEADARAALWSGRRSATKAQQAAISRARRWLGVDADGREHLPRAVGATAADGSPGGYTLRGVSSDWGQFLALVGQDAAATHTNRLLAALDLVRGGAFQGVPPRRYGWAQGLLEEMTASVVDVAHEVARRALSVGDLTTARRAAQVGRDADPLDERVWRDALRTEWAAGRIAEADRLVDELRDRVDASGLELDRETEELVAQIDGSAHGRRDTARWGA